MISKKFKNTLDRSIHINIRSMTHFDIKSVSVVHQDAFQRQQHSLEWILCNFSAFPRMQYYVAELNNDIVGFIHWTQKSGFRTEVVLELEQIAVKPQYQSKGIGKKLIQSSIPMVANHLAGYGATIKHFLVSTRTDNNAQKLYRETLNITKSVVISDLYSSDEIFLVGQPM